MRELSVLSVFRFSSREKALSFSQNTTTPLGLPPTPYLTPYLHLTIPLALHYLTLPYLTLPYLTLPYPLLPYLTLLPLYPLPYLTPYLTSPLPLPLPSLTFLDPTSTLPF